MMAGDAAMLVALADSLFLSIDAEAARGRVLLFLVVSFAPFLVLAPLIGPVIDRVAGGRRTVVQLVAAARLVLSLAIATSLDSLALFPLVFAALVLQKAYAVSKSALVPSVVRTESELVEANSKLGLIAGVVGLVAVIPAGLIQAIGPISGWGPLVYSAALFGVALASATKLSADVVAAQAARPAERAQLQEVSLQLASFAMMLLRAAVGFMFFHLAFWLREGRSTNQATVLFGLAIGLSALGTMAGNALAPKVRRRLTEERILAGALVLAAVAGFGAAGAGGVISGIALAVTVNFAASLGRLAFESIVQREAPQANRGRAFARFETRFQLAWVVAGLLPVVVTVPGQLGFLLVGTMCAVAVGNVVTGARYAHLPRRLQERIPVRRGAGRPLPPPALPAPRSPSPPTPPPPPTSQVPPPAG